MQRRLELAPGSHFTTAAFGKKKHHTTILHFIEVECQNQPYNEQVFLGSFGKILLLFPMIFDDTLIFPIASPNIPDNFSPQKFFSTNRPPTGCDRRISWSFSSRVLSAWWLGALIFLSNNSNPMGQRNIFWGGGGSHGTQRHEGSFSPVESGSKVFFKAGKLLADFVAIF